MAKINKAFKTLFLTRIISDYFVYISFKIKRIRHVFCFLRAFLFRTQKAAEYLIRSFRRFLPPGRSSLNDMQHVRTPHAAERIPGRNHNILAFFRQPSLRGNPARNGFDIVKTLKHFPVDKRLDTPDQIQPVSNFLRRIDGIIGSLGRSCAIASVVAPLTENVAVQATFPAF